MSLEAFWLRAQGWPRHDSMYLFLPLTMLFLFSLLLNGGRGQDRHRPRLSLLIYLLHPWSIVLVRGAAKLTGLEALLIQNSLAHFCAVAALTLCAALVLDALRPLRPAPCGRAWKELDLGALRAQRPHPPLRPVPRLHADGGGQSGRLRPRGGAGGPLACGGTGCGPSGWPVC